MTSQPHPDVLVVLRRRDAEMNLKRTVDHFERDGVTALKLWTECRESIELTVNVRPSHKSTSRSPAGVRTDDHDLAVQRRPLALNSEQPLAGIKDQVVAAPFDHRPVDVVLHLEASLHDRRFGDGAFLIRRQHGQHSTRASGRTVAHPGDRSV
ncbi:MAG TPA: hypothetical protein VH210_02440 [Gaiellaceae bacterium]|nr:hypothetical protein [Gaiellaceae bacterium]